MKASKFSDAQKAFILKQGEQGLPVAEICRKAGISQATSSIGRRSTRGPEDFGLSWMRDGAHSRSTRTNHSEG